MKATAENITQELLNRLWKQFKKRVSYASIYEQLVSEKGGRVVFDHIALRTFNTHTGEQPEGIRAFSHIIEILGFKPVEKFNFPKRKLNAVHFEHPGGIFPKIFVSQIEVQQLPEWAQMIINSTVKDTMYLLSDSTIELLLLLKREGVLTFEAAEMLVEDLVNYFRRPWSPPNKNDLLQLNDVSQYSAWVLLHGNSINHFTALINLQGVDEWPDLETTYHFLKEAGVPMRESIEGVKGGKLMQAATLAAREDVEVSGEDGPEKIRWTYASFELAQRDFVEENGELKLFPGFLSEQDRHLFDVTTIRDY